MNKAKRADRAKAKAKESRITRAARIRQKPEPEYKWDGENWIRLDPFWVKDQGQAYRTTVMPEGFEPK